LQDLRERFFAKDGDGKARDRRLVELNVLAQMFFVKQIELVRNAIRDRGLQVHGFIYNTNARTCERILVDSD
jgi:carbonic anhydrase